MDGLSEQKPAAGSDAERAARVAALVEVALSEFAGAGLHGARVDGIARRAGMNKRLLYHYVGDKEALFDAALALAVARVLAQPGKPRTDEWRLICHGVASGRLGSADLEAVARAAGSAEALGLTLLASLLPELAVPSQIAEKPRLTLRPTLRPAVRPRKP